MKKIKIVTLYQFTRMTSLAQLQASLVELCYQNNVFGSLLLAKEGINGTIAGLEDGINNVLEFIGLIPGCSDVEKKISFSTKIPFLKLRIRLKKEIVTMGQPEVKPSARVGKYIEAEHWNEFTSSDDVVLIDTRNDYEVSIGTFTGAINPKTKKFRDFPEWWTKNASRLENKKIAMFCTGGIRCEKSTNFLLSKGVKDVYHLKGGILKYLEKVDPDKSKWEGECFVFDQRVSLKHGLEEGSYHLCFACRRPISEEDKLHNHYEEGVSCPYCYFQHTNSRKEGFRERQKQLRMKQGNGVIK